MITFVLCQAYDYKCDMINNMNEFSERLKELRIENGLSQRDLANATNLSQAAIAHWEKNRRIPSADVIIIFAKFFDVSADYLLGLKDNK